MQWGNFSQEELEKLISHLDTLYHVLGEDCYDFDGNLVTDSQYDELKSYFEKKYPHSKILQEVHAGNEGGSQRLIKHYPPMTSISKANGTLEEKTIILNKWMKDCELEISQKQDNFSLSYKHDGVACRLYYEKGKLVKAGLRPRNGVDGEDVTLNVKYVKGVLEELPLPLSFSISGELECYISDFEKINQERQSSGEEIRANPRNHAAGSIRQFKDPIKTRNGKLRFCGYSIENFDYYHKYYKTEVERAKWCNKVLGIPFVQVRLFDYTYLKNMEDNVPNLDYEVDGVVISVNNLEEQEQLGKHGDRENGNPKGKIAWKFSEQSALVEIRDVTWQVGRTGKITPVLKFNSVKLAGTTVSQCTGHNLGWMNRELIGVGTKVRVIKSGKIIPKVIEVVSEKTQPIHPTTCPSCNFATILEEGSKDNIDLICSNKKCPAKNVNSIAFFLTTLGAKGIAESTIEKIVDFGIAHKFSDFFALNEQSLMEAGFTERQALLILASLSFIENPSLIKDNDKLRIKIDTARSKKYAVPLWQFLASFGIPNAGKGAAKLLVDEFGNIDKILNATVDQMTNIPNIGEKTAISILVHFKEYLKEIILLQNYFDLQSPQTGSLSGKNFCFSGGFAEGKSFWEKTVESLGGKCSSSVSAKTSYLVAGEGSGSKSDKASKLGVPIISIQQLKEMTNG